ncbi:MAG: HAMP domain-containing protein, partial [Firmicutes bacterium]|nr:HAMP domain-containing protein [Bacillota bacterium]
MKSIRTKFFVQFGLIVVFMIVVLFIANNVFLKPYYINTKEKLMEGYYSDINSLDVSEYTNNTSLIRTIEFSSNFDILIINQVGEVTYSSRIFDINPPPPPILAEGDQYVISVMNEPNVGGETLVLRGVLDNGYLVQLRSPISGIVENIQYVNEFLLYVGLIGFMLSILISYALANNFTKPIRKINDIAKQMKRLDFSNYLETSSKDELGELSESINNLAQTLSIT